jgi:hypothetical protein
MLGLVRWANFSKVNSIRIFWLLQIVEINVKICSSPGDNIRPTEASPTEAVCVRVCDLLSVYVHWKSFALLPGFLHSLNATSVSST